MNNKPKALWWAYHAEMDVGRYTEHPSLYLVEPGWDLTQIVHTEPWNPLSLGAIET